MSQADRGRHSNLKVKPSLASLEFRHTATVLDKDDDYGMQIGP